MAKISIAFVFWIIFCCSSEGAPAENNAEVSWKKLLLKFWFFHNKNYSIQSEVHIEEVRDGLFYSMPGQTDSAENMMIIYTDKGKVNSLDPLGKILS